MILLASVQTSADTAPMTTTQVIVALAAVLLFVALVAAPELCRAWREANAKVADLIDLDEHRQPCPVVPITKGRTR